MSMLHRVLASCLPRDRAQREMAAADPKIDLVVQVADRRLATLDGHRDRLRAPMVGALAAVQAAIARIPGTIEVTARSWARDSTVRALFPKGSDAAAAFRHEAAVRQFFTVHPAESCLGLLVLRQVERRMLSVASHGESLHSEVPCTAVAFTEPRVLAPGPDEAAVRSQLVDRALVHLALRAMERAAGSQAHRADLENQRALLHVRLRLARARGAGFTALAAGESFDTAARESELARLAGDLERTVEATPGPTLLQELIEAIVDVLGRPEEHLAIAPCTLALDAMNFTVVPSADAVIPNVATLMLGERGPFAVVVGRFPRSELRLGTRPPEAADYF